MCIGLENGSWGTVARSRIKVLINRFNQQWLCLDWHHKPTFWLRGRRSGHVVNHTCVMSVATRGDTLIRSPRQQRHICLSSPPQQRSCFASRTDRASSVCYPWHQLAAKSFAGCALVSLYLKGLFAAMVGKHLCMLGGTLSPQPCFCLCCLCVFLFVPPTFAVIYIAVFTWFRAPKEKTNKDMSSTSFITGQPVISASAVVSLRRCRLICLSLSKTCLCGPFDQLHSCREIVCGLGVCEVCVCVCLIVNYEFFSHAPTPVKQSVSYA